MKIYTNSDPCVVEHALLNRVDRVHPTGRPGSTCILVPTVRLAGHLQARLAEVRAAWLGLDVLQFRGIARAILGKAGRTPPALLGPRLSLELLRQLLIQGPTSKWQIHAARRPGTVQRIAATFLDLRDAGITADQFRRGIDADQSELAELYGAYEVRLKRCSRNGWTDEAGLISLALEHAEEFASHWDAILLYGAAELTGLHTDLIHRLDRLRSVEMFLLHRPDSRAYEFAGRFAGEFLLQEGESFEPIAIPESGFQGRLQLDALFDERSRPQAPSSVEIHAAHAQGAATEVHEAVLQSLKAVGLGADPSRIVILARSLEPYAAAIEEAALDAGVPIESSLTGPLRRKPPVQDLLLFLKVIHEDFPRRATVDLLRSPRLRWAALAGLPRPPAGVAADAWSRSAKIIGGRSEWRAQLPTADRADPDGVRGVLDTLDAFARALPNKPCNWSLHASRLVKLLPLFFDFDGERSAELRAMEGLLAEMDRLETVLGATDPVPVAEMAQWLEEAVQQAAVPLDGTRGGIQILDAMQARGMTFDRVLIVGMNSGMFPRAPREDALLGDSVRMRLRKHFRRPLPIQAHRADEERWLLASMLGSARDSIHLSWQRADESGRAKTPSLALREVNRMMGQRPDVDELVAQATHLPSHPLQALQDRVDRLGILAPDDRRLLAALSFGEKERSSLAQEFSELTDGIRMLDATQSFVPAAMQYDGRVGPPLPAQPLSVSGLEMLGHCPLKYFFARRLRVRAFEDEANSLEFSTKDLGVAVHQTLETLLRTLSEEGRLEGDSDAAVRRASEWIEENRASLLGRLGRRMRANLPLLWERVEAEWADAILRFLKDDLRRWMDEGWSLAELEQAREVRLEPNGSSIELRGRFDRVLRKDGKVRIGDYKTSGKLSKRGNRSNLLKGRFIQVPIYSEMAEGAEVELLGVGPGYAESAPEDRRILFDGWEDSQASSFRDTIATLIRLNADGCFPLRTDEHCRWCEFRSGCRTGHPPTESREETATDTGGFRRLQAKSTRKPDPPQVTGDEK